MSELTHLSLFSGIGGLDLAAEWAGFRTVGQCEWADYPRAVLEKHWPGLPRWRDIRTLTKESFYEQTGLETVTVLSGGFPCQPFSTAGKRRGKEDDRYLWPEMLRVIQEIRPRWVVGENVAGIVSLALDTVLSDLEGISYSCQAVIIPACAVDAPHRRDRCAILAYCNSGRRLERVLEVNTADRWESPQSGFAYSGEVVAYTNCGTMWDDSNNGRTSNREVYETIDAGVSRGAGETPTYANCIRLEKQRLQGLQEESAVSAADYHWWPAEPDVGRVANGIPNRVDRLKCLGNAVVPQQFYPIFRAIAELED